MESRNEYKCKCYWTQAKKIEWYFRMAWDPWIWPVLDFKTWYYDPTMAFSEKLVNMQPALGYSLLILKVQQKTGTYLGGFGLVSYHILCVMEKIEMFVLSLLHRIRIMRTSPLTRELCSQTEKCTTLLVLPLTSPCSIPYSLLACSSHAKLQVVYNLCFQDR